MLQVLKKNVDDRTRYIERHFYIKSFLLPKQARGENFHLSYTSRRFLQFIHCWSSLICFRCEKLNLGRLDTASVATHPSGLKLDWLDRTVVLDGANKKYVIIVFFTKSNGMSWSRTMVGESVFVPGASGNLKLDSMVFDLPRSYRSQSRRNVRNKVDYFGSFSDLRRSSNSCMRFS